MLVLFSGLNGVVLDMVKPLNASYPFLTLTYYDKYHFKYRARSRGSTANAILCEKGKVHFTGYTYKHCNVHPQVLTDIAGYMYKSLLTLQGTPTVHY